MDSYDRAWVAGLLEGEGCFGSQRKSRHQSEWRVQCKMTDYDVIKRLRKLSKVGTISVVPACGRRKEIYYWRCSGEPAIALMRELLPLMGLRRSRKIRELLTQFKKHRVSHPDHRIRKVTSGTVYYTRNVKKWCRDNKVSYHALQNTFRGRCVHASGYVRET